MHMHSSTYDLIEYFPRKEYTFQELLCETFINKNVVKAPVDTRRREYFHLAASYRSLDVSREANSVKIF